MLPLAWLQAKSHPTELFLWASQAILWLVALKWLGFPNRVALSSSEQHKVLLYCYFWQPYFSHCFFASCHFPSPLRPPDEHWWLIWGNLNNLQVEVRYFGVSKFHWWQAPACNLMGHQWHIIVSWCCAWVCVYWFLSIPLSGWFVTPTLFSLMTKFPALAADEPSHVLHHETDFLPYAYLRSSPKCVTSNQHIRCSSIRVNPFVIAVWATVYKQFRLSVD